ncbi:MAG: hypothetical protein IT537_09800 [Hyphomicrobiales bacterium]|nr:hypothetical protein [Hyphomicrobiales bacterium]
MASFEIRDYCGDFEDVAELTRRVWMPEYSDKIWVPVPDPAYLKWRLGPGSEGVGPVAYAGGKLVGTIFSAPHPLLVAGAVIPGSLSTVFTVDPEHRRVALPLVEEMRRRNEERGIEMTTGMILGDATSASYLFWTKYAESFPQSFRFLFRGTYLAKFLSPRAMARAGLRLWERVASRALGPVIGFIPFGKDPHVREYRAEDAQRCVPLLNKGSTGLDFAFDWPPDRWSFFLSNPTSATLVYERDGSVRGMMHYHFHLLQGREQVRAAVIDLYADDDLTSTDRIRFISHLCTCLRASDIHVVLAVKCPTMPNAALLANLFSPVSDDFFVGVHLTGGAEAPAPPKRWSFVIT